MANEKIIKGFLGVLFSFFAVRQLMKFEDYSFSFFLILIAISLFISKPLQR